MRRPSSPTSRSALAVAVSALLHAGLGVAWLLQRPPPPPPSDPPAITVTLVTPRSETKPNDTAERSPAQPPLATPVTARASPRSTPSTSPFTPRSGPAATAAAAALPAPEPTDAMAAFGQAMAARSRCRDLERLTDAERDRCTALVMAAPERRARETNPYIRAGEHVALMAEVRHRENTAPRMSCESSRNLDPTCPNALPDNRPSDYALPRD